MTDTNIVLVITLLLGSLLSGPVAGPSAPSGGIPIPQSGVGATQ